MRNNKRGYIWTILSILLVITIFGFIAINSQSCSRFQKSVDSEYGGLYRTVTVYSMVGTILAEETGQFDVQFTSEGNKVLFDLDGKRHIYYNCMVSVIEKDPPEPKEE